MTLPRYFLSFCRFISSTSPSPLVGRRTCHRQELETLIGLLVKWSTLTRFRNCSHPVSINTEFPRGLQWWLAFFQEWNGMGSECIMCLVAYQTQWRNWGGGRGGGKGANYPSTVGKSANVSAIRQYSQHSLIIYEFQKSTKISGGHFTPLTSVRMVRNHLNFALSSDKGL